MKHLKAGLKRHERALWSLLNAGIAGSLFAAAHIRNLSVRSGTVTAIGIAWAVLGYASGYLKGSLDAADTVGEGIARLLRGAPEERLNTRIR